LPQLPVPKEIASADPFGFGEAAKTGMATAINIPLLKTPLTGPLRTLVSF
jgi:hypothetical protein